MATLLFDLDGTLINSEAVVLPAYERTLQEMTNVIPSDHVMRKTFGLSDDAIWKILLPDASQEERDAAFALCEETVRTALFETNILLPQAVETLQALHRAGHTLTVASNCGEMYLDAVLDSQAIRHLFTDPLCLGSVQGQRKADILSAHIKRFGKHDMVMIGDRLSDVEAAITHGIPCVGCALGFGDAAELAHADIVVYQLSELIALFPPNLPPLLAPAEGR